MPDEEEPFQHPYPHWTLILEEAKCEPPFETPVRECSITLEDIDQKLYLAERRRHSYINARLQRIKALHICPEEARLKRKADLDAKMKAAEERRNKSLSTRYLYTKAQIPKPKVVPSAPMTAKSKPTREELLAKSKKQALDEKQKKAEERRKFIKNIKPPQKLSSFDISQYALLARSMPQLIREEEELIQEEQRMRHQALDLKQKLAEERRNQLKRKKVLPKDFRRF